MKSPLLSDVLTLCVILGMVVAAGTTREVTSEVVTMATMVTEAGVAEVATRATEAVTMGTTEHVTLVNKKFTNWKNEMHCSGQYDDVIKSLCFGYMFEKERALIEIHTTYFII